MRVGLQVGDDRGRLASAVVETGWTAPPPVGARWFCCRRAGLAATVTVVEWAGLDGEPDAWVVMSGDQGMPGHLVDRHRFAPGHH